VSTGPLADPVNGQPRSAALTAALDKQYSSGGGAVSFTTLRIIYGDMLANFRAGLTNSVLVITGGPHTDQSLDGPGLRDFIRKSADPAKPVEINVIDFGGDPDRATWEAVAQLSGGTYQNLASMARPNCPPARRPRLRCRSTIRSSKSMRPSSRRAKTSSSGSCVPCATALQRSREVVLRTCAPRPSHSVRWLSLKWYKVAFCKSGHAALRRTQRCRPQQLDSLPSRQSARVIGRSQQPH